MEEAVAVNCLKPLVPQDVLTPVLLLQLPHHHHLDEEVGSGWGEYLDDDNDCIVGDDD